MIMKQLVNCVKTFMALLIAFIFVNGICMVYYHYPYWLDRLSNATHSVWRPGAYVLQCKEGFGYHTVDSNGYVNENLPLNVGGGYTLVLGSSHTQGKEVGSGKRYTDILNALLCREDGITDALMVYNMASDGHYFPALVSGLEAAVREFPDSSCVVLEIGTTTYSMDDLRSALVSRKYDEEQTASQLVSKMDPLSHVRAFIKENFPLIQVIKNQLTNIEKDLGNMFGIAAHPKEETEEGFDEEGYYYAVKATAEKIRSEYDGKIIILYHPEAELTEDGNIAWDADISYDIFRQAIEDSGVIFLDLQTAFQKAYDEYHVVPYGFNNTCPAEGHMNQYGHQIAAAELYEVLKGER